LIAFINNATCFGHSHGLLSDKNTYLKQEYVCDLGMCFMAVDGP